MIDAIFQTEAQLQHFPLFVGQAFERFAHSLPQHTIHHFIQWFGGIFVFNVIAKRAVILITHRAFQ